MTQRTLSFSAPPRRTLRRAFVVAVVLLLAGDLVLLVSGRRVLVARSAIAAEEAPADAGIVRVGSRPEPGNPGAPGMACRYFTGIGLRTLVHRAPPPGAPGHDPCPLVAGPDGR